MLVCKYVDETGLATMLAAKRSAGVAPEVNLRIPLNAGGEACKWGGGSTLALKPVTTSLEVQNRDISGPTKRTDVHQRKEIKRIPILLIFRTMVLFKRYPVFDSVLR